MITEERLSEIVQDALDNFYRRRLQKLAELNLSDTLRKKNPYLFRAVGIQNGPEIVTRLLQAYMSSSEETIFGDAFFEPVVRAVCSGSPAGSRGVDVTIESNDEYTVVSVKSGPNWGNSSQIEKLKQDFEYARRVYDNKKIRKQFRALLGHGYGRKSGEATAKRPYNVRSGQAFWQELTDDPEFYLRLARAMEDFPDAHAAQYREEWERAINRFTSEFLNRFSDKNGSINWDALLEFNSGA